MKISLLTVGAPQLSFAKEGFSEYMKRLERFHNVSVTHVKDGKNAERELLRISQGTYIVALDENGKMFSSRELSAFLDEKALHGISSVTFLIGGPEGHSKDALAHADFIWSLSGLTLPHDLAMLFTAEALYRASTISVGHPYHRG